jgi:chromosome segregation ATPase
MALVEISEHKQLQGAPPPPPNTWGPYAQKSGESGGVIAMVNLLIKDLDKEMTEAETDEKNAQSDYETMMKESAAKRSTDSKSLTRKVSTLADTEAELESLKEAKESAGSELMALTKYIASLHTECDWLLQYHSVRKEARADEIDSLGKAKAVLSGADFAMLQTRGKGFLRP